MTYTYKLARRLAISRRFGMVTSILLFAACSGDSTGPDTGTSAYYPTTFLALRVVPGAATVETGQKLRFRGESHQGRYFDQVTWEVSGGSIDASGTFSASEPGTYKVVGRGRGRSKSDTSVVIVVPPQPDVISIVVTPDSTVLSSGSSHTFAATGVLSDGSTAPVGVTWAATGGTIDAGGAFTAGSVGGTYHVVAINSSGTIRDTATVQVTVPPPPAPTLEQVVLRPGSSSLTTGATQQFAAFGRNSLGDSVAVTVTFVATGGTISSSGLYTAGSTGGTFRVIASSGGLADTSVVTLTAPAAPAPTPAPSLGVGLPFGASQQLSRAGSLVVPFTMTADGYSAGNILSRIGAARTGGYRLLMNLTGGPHEDYMSVIDGVYQFDESKWVAKLQTYNTATIRNAVAQAVTDGVIVGNSVMDEPYVSGGANGGGNTWGPKGTMTKARVDRLCQFVKDMFPTLPVGVAHQHDAFEPTKSYAVCEFIIDQYDHRRGDVREFRDDGLALAQRDGHSIMFGINILDGGVQDRDGTYDCTGPGQGGVGTFAPNCRMTPEQVRDWGLLLGRAGCGLFMWRYDDKFIANPDNQRALRDLAAGMASATAKSCRKP